jgi:hypothetical protein
VVEELNVGSKHLNFALNQLLGPDAPPALRATLTPAQVAEIRLLVASLSRGVDAEGSPVEDQLIVASRLFLAANTLTAHYHAAAQAAENAVELAEARQAIAIREHAAATNVKVTDKSVEASVEMSEPVVEAKARHVLLTELNDIAYGLREAVKMRFDALRQASDNRRVAMKMEG